MIYVCRMSRSLLPALVLGMAILGGVAHAAQPQAASADPAAPPSTPAAAPAAQAAPPMQPAGVVGFGWG